MIVALDVHYPASGGACAAAVMFADWPSSDPTGVVTTRSTEVAPYRPGGFYLRELPCLLAVLGDLPTEPDVVIIDGYVHLGGDGKPGLGAHLFDALGGRTPVLGVAKTPFRGTPSECEVLRGASVRPLYVTAIGMDANMARERVRDLHGQHRIPTMLRLADTACRQIVT